MDELASIREAAFRVGWCKTWGLPCEGAHSDCCKNRESIEAVSLAHVEDCLRPSVNEAC